MKRRRAWNQRPSGAAQRQRDHTSRKQRVARKLKLEIRAERRLYLDRRYPA